MVRRFLGNLLLLTKVLMLIAFGAGTFVLGWMANDTYRSAIKPLHDAHEQARQVPFLGDFLD